MDWKDSYRDAENSDEDDPFPKMLESDVDSILGPYVATELATVEKALCFAGIGPDDCVLDLGSGDGRFCVAAAQQFKVRHAVGVEIDDSLVKASARHADQCGVSDRTTFMTLDLTDPGLDISALAPRPHRVTLAIVFLLPESEKLFERHVRSLYDAGGHVLSLAFALDRLGLQLLMAETPMFLYGKTADRRHRKSK